MSGGDLPDEDIAAIGRNIEHSPARCAWQAARSLWATAQGDLGPAREELRRGVAALADAPLDANWLYAATASAPWPPGSATRRRRLRSTPACGPTDTAS